MTFTVLVTGGRSYMERARVCGQLDMLEADHPDIFVIEGGATGADQWARFWRSDRQRPGRTFRAQWHIHGKKAGFIRNGEMLAEGRPDLVLAFPGGRGTADMVAQAEKAGVPVKVIV